MNEFESERFETQLRQTAPAKPPPDFMTRLAAAGLEVGNLKAEARNSKAPVLARREASGFGLRLSDFLRVSAFGFRISTATRWLVPVTALVAVAALAWRLSQPVIGRSAPKAVPVTPALTADDVQIGQELVSSFDAVARLPSGEPVRFRCRKWMDEMVVHDKQRGVVIQKRTPRLEVVPVRYETY